MNYAPSLRPPIDFEMAIAVLVIACAAILGMAYYAFSVPVVLYSAKTGMPVSIEVEGKVLPLKKGEKVPERHYSVYVDK